MEALQQLLLFWVGSPCEVTAEWCKGLHKHGSSSNDARPSSSGIGLAVALLERESQLLHAAAAAAVSSSSTSTSTGIKPIRTGAIARLQAAATAATASPIGSPRPGAFSTRQQQQQQQQQQYADDVEGDSPVTHASQLPEGGLVWGGNVTAVASAVMTAVSQCSSTNQWAKLEQLLDAASAALTAAAAMQQQQQQQHAAATRMDSHARQQPCPTELLKDLLMIHFSSCRIRFSDCPLH